MTDPFFVTVDSSGGAVPIVSVAGEIDMVVAPRLKACLVDLARAEPKAIVVDMSQVSFMDSTGLWVLSATRKQLVGNGGRVILSGLQPQVGRLLELAGMERLFGIASTRAQALADAGVLHLAGD